MKVLKAIKKITKVFIITFLSVFGLLLVAFFVTGGNSSEGTENKEVASSQTKKEETKKEDPASEKFRKDVSNAISQLNEDISYLFTLSDQVVSEPSLLVDEVWVTSVQLTTGDIKEGIEKVRAIKEPEDKDLKEVYEYLNYAMNHYSDIANNFPKAVETLDSTLFDKCIESMKLASYNMSVSNEAMDRYNERF